MYALKTAKTAGFRCVGVYDAQGESNQQGLEEAADVYLYTLKEFPLKWTEL